MELIYEDQAELPWSKRVSSSLRSILGRQETGIILLCIVLVTFFYSRNPAMLAPLTIVSVLRTMAFPALIGMGMVQLMIAGEIDL